jgi:selenocysteine-specific elongation factor
VSALPVIFKPGHEIRLNEDQRRTVDHLMTQFSNNPYAPPTIKSSIDEIGEDLYNALVDTGRLIPVSGEVVFRWEDYQEMVAQLIQMFEATGSISVAKVRDHFKTSRRYILALLEHLDSIGTTIRKGDVRVLKE